MINNVLNHKQCIKSYTMYQIISKVSNALNYIRFGTICDIVRRISFNIILYNMLYLADYIHCVNVYNIILYVVYDLIQCL